MYDALGSASNVLVLGGSSDIGVAIAQALASRGAGQVVLAGRSPDALSAAAESVSAVGAKATTARFDADDAESHPAFLTGVVEQHGDLDVVVVAFGVLGDQELTEHDAAAAVATVRTNFLVAVIALTLVAEQMKRQGHGRIVVLSSVAGEKVRRSNYVYGSSKAGLDGFALGLGEALRGTGVSLLVVRPGFVVSSMTEGRPKAPASTTPEAVATATLKGLDKGAAVIWVPGRLRLVMSVLRHVPRGLFRHLPV